MVLKSITRAIPRWFRMVRGLRSPRPFSFVVAKVT